MAQEPRPTRLSEARLPTAIGRYKVVSRLGKGAMGVVYHAHDELMDRAVAIKVLTADLAGDPSIRTRFFREAKVAGQIVHPNVITVFDMGEENGRLYIVMELLHGLTLGDHLRANPGLSLGERLDVMAQVCAGMSAAHARGVVHRDLKPSNLFVQSDGVVKLLDFGVARLADSNVTAAGLIIGTPDYMSPEQARGGEVDQRADVFSAGSVFYFLLTGRKPFAARDLPTLLLQVEQSDPSPIPEQEVPAAVSSIVMKALQKDPARRYQSFAELLADLQRFRKAHEAESRRMVQEARAAFAEAQEHAALAAAAAAVLGYDSRAPLEVASLASRAPALDASRPAGEAAHAGLLRDAADLTPEVLRVRDQCAEDARRAAAWLERHRAAEAAWRSGDLDAAEREFLEVSRQQPAATVTSAHLAHVRAEIEAAAERARREQALVTEAGAALAGGQWDAARRLAEDALALVPDSAAATEARERALAGAAREQEAAERRARAASRASAAGLALAGGDPQAAARLAEEALALDADSDVARDVLARVRAALAEAAERASRLARAEAHAAAASNALQRGRHARAITEGERALALHPEDAVTAALVEEARRREAARAHARASAPAWATPRVLGLAGAGLALILVVLVVAFATRDAGPAAPAQPVEDNGAAPAASPDVGATPASATTTPAPVPAVEPAAASKAPEAPLPGIPRAPGEDDARFNARREDALAKFNEGQSLLGRGRFAQALSVFEDLARAEPAYPGIEERIVATRREIEASEKPSGRRLFAEGNRLESGGDMLGAMARYRAAKAAEPDLDGLDQRMASLAALMVARAERLISEADADRSRGDGASAIRRYEEALKYLPAEHAKAPAVRQLLEKLRAGTP